MAQLIVPTDTLTPTELRINAFNERTSIGERDNLGNIIPAGTIYVVCVLAAYRDGVYQYSLPNIIIPDAAAWINQLAQLGDPLTATAAQKFALADDSLKWLAALKASELGLCERPVV